MPPSPTPRSGDIYSSHKDPLLDLDELDIEDESAVGRDAGEGLAAVGEVGGNSQPTLATDGHAENTNVPALDDLTLANLEAERRALLVGIKNLAVLELANVTHANAVAVLHGAAGTSLAVVDGDTVDNLDTKSLLLGGLLSSLVLSRAGRALLKVLGELDLLITLGGGRLLGLSSSSLALVLLLLLVLLLVLGNQLVEALGLLLSGSLLALLLGIDKLGSLLVGVDLLDALSTIDLVELIAHVIIGVTLEDGAHVVIVVLIGLLIGILVLLVLGDHVVASDVDSVGTGDGEEDPLALANDKVDGLLVGLCCLSVCARLSWAG